MPKKDSNASKFMQIAMNEIDGMEKKPNQKLSTLQKNRLALKFVEMNASPDNFDYFQRFTEENIKSVKLNLKQ